MRSRRGTMWRMRKRPILPGAFDCLRCSSRKDSIISPMWMPEGQTLSHARQTMHWSRWRETSDPRSSWPSAYCRMR